MNKILTIIKREYITRVRSRLFIIITFLMPVIIAAFTVVPFLIIRYGSDTEKIAVIDQSKMFAGKLKNQDNVQFGFYDAPFDSMKRHYAEKGFTGVLFIPSTFLPDKPEGIQYFSNDQLGLGTEDNISGQLTDVVTRLRLEKVNVTPEVIDQLSTPVHFDTIIGSKEGNTGAAAAVGYFAGFLLYILLIIYGMQVMRGVMEEKSNRIAEVIVSSVKPFQMMFGKIIGIALLGLTQFAVWIIMGIVAVSVLQGMVGDTSGIQDQMKTMQEMNAQPGMVKMVTTLNQSLDVLPVGLIIFGVVFYFLFGYLMYSSLFAAIGAASGDEADQSLTFIATMPIIISFFLSFNAMNAPNSSLSVFSSLFPLTSPIVMPARLAYEPPPMQIILSMLFLIIGFLFMVWLAGRIYRTGILMYGKKGSLKEMIKWIRY
ncbi:MAG: ABC transporter permease [Chitinophagales bacterium]